MAYLKTVTVEVEVDIHTDDLDPDDLEEIALKAKKQEDLSELIDEMFVAFKLSRDDQALVLARRLVEQHTGRIL